MIKIETPEWLAEIAPESGANLYRLQHRAGKTEVLRSPESLTELQEKPECYGIPVLFPPNRIADGRFTWQGRQYVFPLNESERGNHLHGLILGKPWRLTRHEPDLAEMTYDFAAIPGYPHDFTLTLTYRFTPEAVIQTFAVQNRSTLAMPFAVGFHTAFVLPAGQVRITAGEHCWEILRPRHLPSGKPLPWPGNEPVYHDLQVVSRHAPMATEIIDGQPFRGAIIDRTAEHVRIYYEADAEYRHWCLWNNGGGQGFFCAEPMTWMVNAPNLDLPPEVTGMQGLEPGRNWQAQTVIRVVSLP